MATNNGDRALGRIPTCTPGASPQTTSSPPRFTFQSPRNFRDTGNARAVPFVFLPPPPLTRLSPHIITQVTKPAVDLPPEMWHAVLSHLPPDEVMRVRRVNHLFYAVALDHRFRTLSILDETIDDDEVSAVCEAYPEDLALHAASQSLADNYALIMANRTETNDADPGAFGSERDFGEEFMDCICHVFAHAITLNEVRLILLNTPADDEEVELESLQDLWYRGPRPHGLASLTLQLDVMKLGLRLDRAGVGAPLIYQIPIVSALA
ncbi:hypothetical protein BDN71DRAFT_1514025 [Pleurotus eryngii]|uniref:F-box domain-containing protein n=1 Tax=Pleurotus eryngii TaxID=5323 RepID=A0A9P5ZH98_PLEER|nr:hypothetical protein BDN71DRAFT_1514025 [Pleurotus eryngii]